MTHHGVADDRSAPDRNPRDRGLCGIPQSPHKGNFVLTSPEGFANQGVDDIDVVLLLVSDGYIGAHPFSMPVRQAGGKRSAGRPGWSFG
jgi:hypothetical protein